MILTTPILATTDVATWVMFSISTSVSLITGVGMVVMFRNQDRNAAVIATLNQKLDDAQKTRLQEVKELDDRLHQATQKLVDERMRAISHSVNNHAQQLTNAMDKVSIRVAKGEEEIERLAGLRTETELQLTKALGEHREFVRNCAPSKDEFKELKVEVRELAKSTNELAQKVTTRDDLVEAIREAVNK